MVAKYSSLEPLPGSSVPAKVFCDCTIYIQKLRAARFPTTINWDLGSVGLNNWLFTETGVHY